MAIKLIIFDLSGVCFSNEEPPFVRDFALKHKLPVERFEARYDELIKEAEKGKMGGYELWDVILKEFGASGNPHELVKEMIDQKEAYLDNLEIATKLKRDYETVYFTNYNEDYWELIRKKFDFGRWFSWGLVSYEVGARKPAKEGFQYIMKKAGRAPQETVFIDDSPGNLVEAAALGIHTLRFVDRAGLENALGRILDI